MSFSRENRRLLYCIGKNETLIDWVGYLTKADADKVTAAACSLIFCSLMSSFLWASLCRSKVVSSFNCSFMSLISLPFSQTWYLLTQKGTRLINLTQQTCEVIYVQEEEISSYDIAHHANSALGFKLKNRPIWHLCYNWFLKHVHLMNWSLKEG